MTEKKTPDDLAQLRQENERLQKELAESKEAQISSLQSQLTDLTATVQNLRDSHSELNWEQKENRRMIEQFRKETLDKQEVEMAAHRLLAQGDKQFFVELQNQGKVARLVGVKKTQDEANARAKYLKALTGEENPKNFNEVICEPYDTDKHWDRLWPAQRTALAERTAA